MFDRRFLAQARMIVHKLLYEVAEPRLFEVRLHFGDRQLGVIVICWQCRGFAFFRVRAHGRDPHVRDRRPEGPRARVSLILATGEVYSGA